MLPALARAFFSFRGRLGRGQFALRVSFLAFAAGLAVYLFYLMDTAYLTGGRKTGESQAMLGLAIIAFAGVFTISLLSLIRRRLADRDRGIGYMIFTMLISAAWMTAIETFFLRGTTGPNRFGLAEKSQREKTVAMPERVPTIVSTRKLPQGTIS